MDLAEWIHTRGINKSQQITKYKFWGLMIFVAIPLPGTGVWTGCLAASLIEMDFKRGMLSVVFRIGDRRRDCDIAVCFWLDGRQCVIEDYEVPEKDSVNGVGSGRYTLDNG